MKWFLAALILVGSVLPIGAQTRGTSETLTPTELFERAQRAPSLRELLNLLDTHLPGITRFSDVPVELYSLAGSALETGNRFGEAAEMYRKAFELKPDQWDLLLRSAAMNLEIGNTQEAREALTRVIERATTITLQREAALLRVRGLVMDGEYDIALRHAKALADELPHPATLLLLWQVAGVAGSGEVREQAAQNLTGTFPGSPEAAIVASSNANETAQITSFPGPSTILMDISAFRGPPGAVGLSDRGEPPTSERLVVVPQPIQEPAPVVQGIQTGSFRDRENAQFMVSDLRDIGLEAVISERETERGRFYRVIVPADLSGEGINVPAEELVIRLKEIGIEGFRVFE